MELTVTVAARLRRAGLVKAGFAVLGVVAPAVGMKPETVERIGNALLRLLQVETRIGRGAWARMEHGITVQVLSQ